MQDIENVIKEQGFTITEKWKSYPQYGLIEYIAFDNYNYCASKCEHFIGKDTYCLSTKEDKMLYMGRSKIDLLKAIREL